MPNGKLIYRQSIWTRLTHWMWAICLFFLLLSGLQIFNAHPALYLGHQSGFEFDNALLVLNPFPGWATIPSYQDLGTGRVVHFFFAWTLVGTLLVWFLASMLTRRVKDVLPGPSDLRALPADIAAHAKLRFHHTRRYNPLQKIAYSGILFVVLPLMILTGLTMSPNFNATAPWLLDLFGGRQTARTIHFGGMVLLVGFFVIHMVMILAAGPLNELRSIITGWYRTDEGDEA